MHILKENTVSELLKSSHQELEMLLSEISLEVTMEKALAAPKIFQLRQTLGEKDLLKLLCFILKAFVDSLKTKERLSYAEIIETAGLILGKYTHESIKDIILAFKEAKLSGRKFYGSLSQGVIFEILVEYFLRKAKYLEARQADLRMQEASNEATWLCRMPDFMRQKYAKLLPENHPNRQALRLKLTIDKKIRLLDSTVDPAT